MITSSSLGDMLLKRYAADFVAQMQSLPSPIYQNMTKILGEIDDWRIMKYPGRTESLALYHKCPRSLWKRRHKARNSGGLSSKATWNFALYPNNLKTSVCHSCGVEASDEIKMLALLADE